MPNRGGRFNKEADLSMAWDALYRAAKQVLKPRKISERMDAGGVAAAIESYSGTIYTGVCVDGACALDICAERNAIFQMITNGESEIRRVIAVNWSGKVIPPCGACRELMAQLMPKSYQHIEIMLNYETRETALLGALTPKWWI